MIQVTAQMRILLALEPQDFRKGIDGLACVCREALKSDPFQGTVFVFTNRRRTAVRLLNFDGQGFWICTKRLSTGRFGWWPTGTGATRPLEAHELQVLLWNGNPSLTGAQPAWRRVTPAV